MRAPTVVGSLVLGSLFAGVGAARAQTPDELSAACVDAGGGPARCAAAAVSAGGLQGQLGVLSGLGSEVSGTATTLATRIGGGPKIVAAMRAGIADGGLPAPGDSAGLAEKGFRISVVHADVAVGLFDGFRLAPTVGGFLSLDAIGRAAFVLLPQAEGFDGRVAAYTAGVRVGVFREGFTLPGVSVSLSRRFVGATAYGDPAADPIAVTVDPVVTSARATVGKDLFAVEWLAGVGWDRYTGSATVRVADGVGGTASATGDLEASRRVWFGSASMTFGIVLNVALEAGWAEGFDPVAAYAGQYDPTSGTPFGSVSLRLIL